MYVWKKIIKIQPGRAIVVLSIGERYQTDLVDLIYYNVANDGYCLVLNVIDVYSNYLISIPLIIKSAAEVKTGLKIFLIYLVSQETPNR